MVESDPQSEEQVAYKGAALTQLIQLAPDGFVILSRPTSLAPGERGRVRLVVTRDRAQAEAAERAVESSASAAMEPTARPADLTDWLEATLSGASGKVDPASPLRQNLTGSNAPTWVWWIEAPARAGTIELDLLLLNLLDPQSTLAETSPAYSRSFSVPITGEASSNDRPAPEQPGSATVPSLSWLLLLPLLLVAGAAAALYLRPRPPMLPATQTVPPPPPPVATASVVEIVIQVLEGAGEPPHHHIQLSGPAGTLGERVARPPLEPLQAAIMALLESAGEQRGELEKIGRHLFELLLPTPGLQSLFYQSLSGTNNEALEPVRLKLIFPPDSPLHALPWELLYNTQDNRFFSLRRNAMVLRWLPLPDSRRTFTPIREPLRLLAIISNPLGDLDVAAEERAIRAAIAGHAIELTTVRGTLDDVAARLAEQRPHVLHFIGHGGIDRVSNRGFLLFEGEGGPLQIDGEQLGYVLASGVPELHLVVLNGCETASNARGSVFSAVAPQLVLHGLPAVIAMQFQIRDHSAVAFSEGFYAELAVPGQSLFVALLKARQRLMRSEGLHRLDWATPALFLWTDSDRLME